MQHDTKCTNNCPRVTCPSMTPPGKQVRLHIRKAHQKAHS
jgi:hypothetical protein